jgi:cell division protein FtsQ
MIAESLRARLGLDGLRRAPSRPVARGRAATAQRARRRRARFRIAGLVAVVLTLLLGGWLWLRDSSLVAVNKVTIGGVSGPDAAAIRAALLRAARNMTTLDVHVNELNTAVAPYPVVKRLEVSTQFPHGMRIRVIEQMPVGAITVGGRLMPVAADGTVLHDVQLTGTLPTIPLRVPPGGSRLTGQAMDEVEVLAAAPGPLLARTSQVTSTSPSGLVAQLRHGPSIRFGDASRLADKWAAAAAVLADSGSAGALYVDVTDPQRPAAGGGATTAATSGSGGSASASGVSGATGASASATGVSTTPGTATTTTPASGAAASTTTLPGG